MELVSRIWHRTAREFLGLQYLVDSHSEQYLRKPRVQFLCFHRLLQGEEQWFLSLLRALGASHEFTSYSDGVDRILQNRVDRPYVVISFDDGLKNHYRAAGLLAGCGIPACFFVCPSIVGETRPGVVAEFCRTRLRAQPAEFLDWNELEQLKKLGHEIGGHTMLHEDLSTLNFQEVCDTAGRSRDLISRRLGETRHFAWPYGRFWHFTPEAASAVFASGFESCASAEHGCHIGVSPIPPSELCIRRYTVPANCPPAALLYPLALDAMFSSADGNRWPANWEGIHSRPCLHCELFVNDDETRHSWICHGCRLVRPSVRNGF